MRIGDLPEKPWCFTGAAPATLPGKKGPIPAHIQRVIDSMYADVAEHLADSGGILLAGPPEFHRIGRWVVLRWPAIPPEERNGD